MIGNRSTYQVSLERIDDLRREAEAWRWAKLACAELSLPSSTAWREQPLHPNHARPLTCSPRERHIRPNQTQRRWLR